LKILSEFDNIQKFWNLVPLEMDRKSRRRTHPTPPSLLFLPTDVQPALVHPTHPEQVRDGDAHTCDMDMRARHGQRVVTMPVNDIRARQCSGSRSKFWSVCERGKAERGRDR
jgi:hypothetical protein